MSAILEALKHRNLYSFEVFPPKDEAGMEKLGGVIDKLYTLKPDYISCTYGAGGTNVGMNLDVLKKIQKDGKSVPVTHFTCVGATKAEIKETLQRYLDNGINHILALRGDFKPGMDTTGGELHYATQLIKFIRDEFGDKFTIACAGSPEGHIQCRSLDADITFLKQKQDNGADYVITQLCWDMDAFRRWMDKIHKAGVTMPIDVGILPITSIAPTVNMALSFNACVMDRRLCEIITKYWIFPNPFLPKDKITDPRAEQKKADFRKAGMEYTVKLVDEYRACGVNGIHLYTLNKFEDVYELTKMSGINDNI